MGNRRIPPAVTMQATSAETKRGERGVVSWAAGQGPDERSQRESDRAVYQGQPPERHLDYEGVEFPRAALGLSASVSISLTAATGRATRVWNDRAGEVGRTLT